MSSMTKKGLLGAEHPHVLITRNNLGRLLNTVEPKPTE